MNIIPLLITQVNWTGFIESCQDVLGISPTRGLDAQNMSIKDPAAFLASFDCKNQPIEALRSIKQNAGSRHYYTGFMFVGTNDELDVAYDLAATRLSVNIHRGKKKFLGIISGDIETWFDMIVSGCSTKYNTEYRRFFNDILLTLERVGFKQLFDRYDKQYLEDDTFILKG